MVAKEPMLERLTNLAFAFLNAESRGNPALTAAWVREHVEGYARDENRVPRSERAVEKLFERDRKDLIRVGVPIETVTVDGHVGYRLQADQYRLPELQFTSEEAAVLALAGNMGLGDELATFTRSGWTKIAASGVRRELASSPRFLAVNDWSSLNAELIDAIVSACTQRKRISFTFHRTTSFEPETRWMDPWALVGLRDSVYVVGYDIDRDAPRVFRSTRVSDVELLDMDDPAVAEYGPFHLPEPGTNMQELVEKQLSIGVDLFDVTVHVAPGRAPEITSRGTALGDNRYLLQGVEKKWIVRAAAAHAPYAIVEEPAEVREEVIAVLKGAL